MLAIQILADIINKYCHIDNLMVYTKNTGIRGYISKVLL